VKKIIASIAFLFMGLISGGQNIIEFDTDITRTIKVNDTIDLQFLDWPSPGIRWQLYSAYDTTILSIINKSSRLMEGNFQYGGKYIRTVQYVGLKPGRVELEYFWGRPWLKEKLYYCRLEIIIE
jgi:hypothetical protein